eukprot:CAMPEP_0119374074 /NCGR_PEP_ID=MMETSP1334-20130426/28824_1 /TAXON_ID=127549 /ORGANISM="Calcidiscus leptoporus, Strain RCC1130" /LENGTH=602 /DNA_ID=CAMNT_0007392025 /DNA_START=72 /DNA_END=1880 /DNA_ORIENTATION=-
MERGRTARAQPDARRPERADAEASDVEQLSRRPSRRVQNTAAGLQVGGGTQVAEGATLLAERVEHAAQLAFEACMRPSARILTAGILCLLGPPLVLVVAPLLLLLLPLLMPLGLILTFVGVMQLGVVVSFAHISTLHRFTEKVDRGRASSAKGSPSAKRPHKKSSCGQAWSTESPKACSLLATPPPPLALAATSVGAETDVTYSESSSLRVIDGSLKTLAQCGVDHSERLVRRFTEAVRANVVRAKRDISGEVGQQLIALQGELRTWVGANQNLKPYCHGRIGWLLKQESPAGADLSARFHELLGQLDCDELTEQHLEGLPLPHGISLTNLCYLLVPGLLTKWYPKYMAHLQREFKRLGLLVTFSRVDTDQPIRVNAARIRHEVLELSETGRRIAILGHSKGAVDAAAALSLFPELCDSVAALVSLQGPHGGSAIAHDLSHTQVQRNLALSYVLEKLLRGCKHAVLDMTYSARQDFLERHVYPLERVPTLCLASCDRRPNSLLKPIIDFLALRYGEWSDGCVCQSDAILPGCARVLLDDMDHFGPAWTAFPATDRYEPTRLWLVCTCLALNQEAEASEPRRSSPLNAVPASASASSLLSVGL